MMNKSKLISYIFLIFTIIIWGLSFLSIKVSLVVFPPMTLAFVRFFIALVFLFVFYKISKPDKEVEVKDFPQFIVAGILGITVYFFFENNGIKLLKASEASIIISIIPIMVLVSDAIFFKEKITKLKVVSFILSIVGVIFVVGKITPDTNISYRGTAFMFGSALAWVIYSLALKPMLKKYSLLTIIFYQTLFGTILLVPFIFIEKVNWQLLNLSVSLNILFLGIFCSAIAYYLYAFAMEKIGIGISSLFLNLIPVITVTFSFFILKETITILQILGGILIIASVYLANHKAKIRRNF